MVMAVGVLITTSCKKSFFTKQNINPNALETVTPNLLLPTIEAALSYTLGGEESRYTSLLTQQMFGANSQSQTYYQYGLTPGTFQNLWPNIYTSVMENDYTLIKICDKGGYNQYGGIARMLMAYQLQVAVDFWGDLPYSQSFKGDADNPNLHPSYDKAAGLYDTIASLINVGSTLLQAADAGPMTAGAQDAIFGGSAAKWIKFGHALKARLAIHQSKGSAQMASTALTELALAMGSNSDNAQFVWGTTQNSASPWYQFYNNRPGDQNWVQSTLAGWVTASNDPRFGALDMDSTDADGNAQGYYNKINSPTELITYEEMQFVKAEATLRSGGTVAAAQVAYQAGITASMKKLGVKQADIDAYILAHGTLPVSVNAAIAAIASEEYIALFLNPEVWSLWRRTGSPALTSVTGNQIPRRLVYAQSELDFNAANVPSVTLYAPKLFWDN